MVICSTGFFDLTHHWVGHVNLGALVDDILHLDHDAPERLRNLKRQMKGDFPLTASVTVYHFGFPVNSGPACGFAYRSENDFHSESLTLGVWFVKPKANVPADAVIPNDLLKIMESQRAIQQELPQEGRAWIGGDILVCQMVRDRIATYRMGSFPDKPIHRTQIYDRAKKRLP
jgi:hypothetical protein